MKINKQCPEFPHFGATYPDARCINGFLWDLDKCNEHGLYGGGEVPCPFCNEDEYKEWLGYSDADERGKLMIDNYIALLNQKYNR
jgi:hypothetical protein